jgi:hypothetical protein
MRTAASRILSSGHPAIAMALLLLLLVILRAEVGFAQSWDQRTAGPFVARADFSLDECSGLLGELNQIQNELVRVLGLPQPRETVELILFRDEARYRALVRQRFPNVPYRRALFIKGSGSGAVYAFRGPELPVDLRHEATHGLLHATLPMVPLWLDEGLAEYFEVQYDERASGNPHQAALKWNLRLGMTPHLAKLEAKRDVAEMSASDYRDAWAWVHFMLHGPSEAHQELVQFLGDIRAGTPPGQLSQRLERRLPGLEKRLVAHFKNWPP